MAYIESYKGYSDVENNISDGYCNLMDPEESNICTDEQFLENMRILDSCPSDRLETIPLPSHESPCSIQFQGFLLLEYLFPHTNHDYVVSHRFQSISHLTVDE
jgi:hypothetical protein